MAKTLSKIDLLAKIAAVFAHNPEATELHVTADGNCFLPESKNAAALHSKGSGLKIEVHKRENFADAIAKAEEKKKVQDENNEKARLQKAVEDADAKYVACGKAFEGATNENKEAAEKALSEAAADLKSAKDALAKFGKKK